MAQQQQQQVIYLVMDENNQGQQIQFINGQPTIVVDEPAAVESPSDPGSQVLLVSEDGQLVTGNEGQVLVDDSGQVLMTNDEGQQVALETEHLNVTQPPVQYLEAPGCSKTNILSQAASVITGSKVANGGDKDDGYTTIMIGGDTPASQPAPPVMQPADQVQPTTSITHPILSTQLGASGSPVKQQQSKTEAESPRAMVSILDRARLAASLSQHQKPATSAQQESEPALNGVDQVIHVEERSPEITPQDVMEDEKPPETQQETAAEVAEKETVAEEQPSQPPPEVEKFPPPTKVSTEEAEDLVKSLDDYISKKAEEESSSSVEAKLKTAEDAGPVATGTVLGPFHDSDESGPEPFDEPSNEAPVTIKATEKAPAADEADSSEDSTRRKSARNKSPKRYSEEPIIFGDDWTKKAKDTTDAKRSPSPLKRGRSPRASESEVVPASPQKRNRSPKGETSESDAAEPKAAPSALKRGRSPRGETSESDTAALSEAEQKVPPKKRISREASVTEESKEPAEEMTPRKRGRPPKKRFLEKHNSQEEAGSEVREKRERRLRGEAKEMYDSFGFNDDSEKEEEAPKEKKPEVLIVQKPSDSPVILAVDKPVVTHLPTAPKTKFESPARADSIKIVTSTPAVVGKASQERPSPKLTDVKPVKARPLVGISTGDRKVGIDVKNMKFSVAKRASSSTPLSQRLLSSKKASPAVNKQQKASSSAEDKDLATREAALVKRERKMRALDLELDERTAQLKAKEGKLDRWERKLYEQEATLEAREKKVRRQEKGKGRKSEEQELSEWEGRLKRREQELQDGERQLATREGQLSSLKKELARKYEQMEGGQQQATGPRQGLFERLADLSTESHEEEEPATKKAKRETVPAQIAEAKEETPKRGRGRPPKVKGPTPKPATAKQEKEPDEEAAKEDKEKEQEGRPEKEEKRPQKEQRGRALREKKEERPQRKASRAPEPSKKSVKKAAAPTRQSRMRVAAKAQEQKRAATKNKAANKQKNRRK